jgi:hypothetical protein
MPLVRPYRHEAEIPTICVWVTLVAAVECSGQSVINFDGLGRDQLSIEIGKELSGDGNSYSRAREMWP